ncbi:MAG: tRNA (adenosine(37)-N6)-threonylcarbamoyltransferase complex dimerization subunit type 1 TsaB [Chloroflexi bacterium]|nr:tRNA (adenosine(37)-N6)-threonylcarbamoyltransferase complex dimerization subunit type 1 TsaB [Chloroflexota bacterium]PWB48285.1 MAG: tRNA (adenosine(37)-N6)-threonylcarbamoyltransferase complex dimerization subunit type 1 TsaB [Dehalococcoidia bacterium]
MSTILCIDTASDRFALVLDRDGLVTALEAEAGRDHSKLLLPAIASLLGDEAKLDAILVVTGPGAYAGVRVGIATAEGLGLAHGAGVFGIGTLEAVALARRDEGETGPFAAIHPAGRGEFAIQRFEAGAPAGPVMITALADLTQDSRGEGAAQHGGIEVTPRQRAMAALRDRAPKIRSGELTAGAEAFYLREPNITVSRRQRAAS